MQATINGFQCVRRTNGGDSLPTVDHGPDLSALAHEWAVALQQQGLSSPVRVELWLDGHRESPSPDRVEMLIRRMHGAGVMDLAAEEGIAHSRIQDLLRRTGLSLIVPHLDDIAVWQRARESGVTDEVIAGLSTTRPEVVSLALDGWPSRDQPASRAQVVDAYTAWVSGAPLAEVAGILDMTPARLRKDLAEGTNSLPRRLHTADLARQFGWNKSTVIRHRRRGLLPPPDGRDGVAYWWWETCIDEWTAERDMHECPSCEGIYLTANGLKGHITREH